MDPSPDKQVDVGRSAFEIGLHKWHERNRTPCMCTACRPKVHTRRHKTTEVLMGSGVCSECCTPLNMIIFEDLLHSSTVESTGPPAPNFPKRRKTRNVSSGKNEHIKLREEASTQRTVISEHHNLVQSKAMEGVAEMDSSGGGWVTSQHSRQFVPSG